ncbi:indole-3-glycerol phosphate synthase TrpC [Streptomyces sp. SM14]|uniref:indole-3-glycerol phosphate synthase TrpC n=1 Tax=Streptomyces sp. SM14 TaxID=1736045 RepID=UPI000CD4CB65|nr:indole-3-glycerol phosphate synthase TrpC [Streptomyces sp. SM14]
MSGTAAPALLDRLVAQARAQTAADRALLDEPALREAAETAPAVRDFTEALRVPGLSVIAELKPRSPVKGALVTDYRPTERAAAYRLGGAAAISVLTHRDGFGGSPEHLREVRAHSDLPLLRKDFVVDDYQVWQARVCGADAVLLIATALSAERLAELVALVEQLGMTALVEVHDEAEARVALEVGATVIGVNHRDLRTFSLDLSLTERIAPLAGSGRLVVAESGVGGAADAATVRRAGADAVLVGEALMRSGTPAALIEELRQA